jgi:hypothetical protein
MNRRRVAGRSQRLRQSLALVTVLGYVALASGLPLPVLVSVADLKASCCGNAQCQCSIQDQAAGHCCCQIRFAEPKVEQPPAEPSCCSASAGQASSCETSPEKVEGRTRQESEPSADSTEIRWTTWIGARQCGGFSEGWLTVPHMQADKPRVQPLWESPSQEVCFHSDRMPRGPFLPPPSAVPRVV